MTVSLCIIAYNEEKVLEELLRQVQAQSYPARLTELVLVDSASQDRTKEIFSEFARRFSQSYLSVGVYDNPRRSQAAGWNTALRHATGDIIIRLDAHAEIPEDFILQNVRLIESGEDICGGARPNRIDRPTPFKKMLFLAESSMFGSSIAGYRRQNEEKKYVRSLFHGAYRRDVFAAVGGFNEDLGRTEDNELHNRIRRAGYRICQSSEILSYQHIRGTLSSMLLQKFANGKWIGLTLGFCPRCLSVFHFVPFCFVLALLCGLFGLIAGAVSGIFWLMLPLPLLIGLYLTTDLIMTASAVASAEEKHPVQFLLPAVFFLLHVVYGVGTLIGILALPFLKAHIRRRNRRTGSSAEQEIEAVRQCVISNTKKEDQE